jgi:hypothetical protein
MLTYFLYTWNRYKESGSIVLYLNDSIIHGLLWEEGAMEKSYEDFFYVRLIIIESHFFIGQNQESRYKLLKSTIFSKWSGIAMYLKSELIYIKKWSLTRGTKCSNRSSFRSLTLNTHYIFCKERVREKDSANWKTNIHFSSDCVFVTQQF